MRKKVVKTKFQSDMGGSIRESDCEYIFMRGLSEYKAVTKITIPGVPHDIAFSVDNKLLVLVESKKMEKFNDPKTRCEILIQVMGYLYNISQNQPEYFPDVCIIHDKKEVLLFESAPMFEFVEDISKSKICDWNVGARSIATKYPIVVDKLLLRPDIHATFRYNMMGEGFELKDILEAVRTIPTTCDTNIKITNDNIISIFASFKNGVVVERMVRDKEESDEKYDLRIVGLFYDLLTNTDIGVTNNGKLFNRGKTYIIDFQQYESFKKIYLMCKYETKDLDELVSIKDQLIEEIMRRKTGAYFTPEIWINKAHDMIAEQFGLDWKEKFVVWDCASGTNNLTRDFNFKELYNSTLYQSDVDTVNDMRYPGTTFKYDFLNDNDEKLPPMLIRALSDKKPILFLINPPYGTSAGMIRGLGKTKEGISTKFEMCGTLQKNKTNMDMKNADMGACSEQLYSQFLFRILQMVFKYNININICIFSKPTFMTGESFKKFRKVFYNNFKFKDGILFKADTFADVSGSWGVAFTIWEGVL